MRVLITGAGGQLGQEAVRIFDAAGHTVRGCDRADLDVADQSRCEDVIGSWKPEAVIHCAAYTAVDAAEADADEAYRINAFGARNVAAIAEKIGAKMVYISTDYVFDGQAGRPYREYDAAAPRTVYGESKLAGERWVQSLSSRYFIVRTSWLYGRCGSNFVHTMLRLGAEQESLHVVQDQTGSPTYAVDLARFLLRLIDTDRYGTYHASNTGSCSWYDFARAIFEESGLSVNVLPVTTEQFPRPAPRPLYSVMDHVAIRANGFEDLPSWQDGLRRFLAERKE